MMIGPPGGLGGRLEIVEISIRELGTADLRSIPGASATPHSIGPSSLSSGPFPTILGVLKTSADALGDCYEEFCTGMDFRASGAGRRGGDVAKCCEIPSKCMASRKFKILENLSVGPPVKLPGVSFG